ncbi:6723_t:CDS:2 [Gigaspora margarita]|uniref:6723_t:CDS:1 n=1 Tax=Gigaspora margarita TaxID=4874 RepID=A0ABM8VXN4_GIGMA|nr:6723_t:CDS:2 [Gigaspora margarita]
MNEPMTKHSKHKEDLKDKTLQQLYRPCPDLNSQSVWFAQCLESLQKAIDLYNVNETNFD